LRLAIAAGEASSHRLETRHPSSTVGWHGRGGTNVRRRFRRGRR